MHTIYGKVESKQCNFRMARTRFHVSLVLLREAGDLRSQADTLLNLGTIMRLQGKLKTTQFLYAKSLGFFQAVEDRWNQVACLNGIADVLRLQGHYAEARGRFEECLSLATSLGNHAQRAAALTGLGQIAMHQGDMRRAARYLHESLRLTREIAHTPGMATLLLALGDLERCQGNNTAAIDHYESALSLTRKIGDKVGMANALFGLGDAARAQHEDARACVLLKQSLQVCWEIGDQPGMAVGLEIFAWFCRQIGLLERSVQFLATADALLDWLQIPLPPPLLTNHERELSMLRAELDEAIFKETWSYGRTMTLKLAMSMVARVHMSEHQPPPSEKAPVPAAYPANLTAREVDVLRLVASGLPDARIAEQLVLSPRTVNTHLRSIYAKIGVSSRSAATRWAFEHKLV
jgi:DNA-binding CsgD family transcriptional regulator/tetratricopeptide (TPR) repeat protein